MRPGEEMRRFAEELRAEGYRATPPDIPEHMKRHYHPEFWIHRKFYWELYGALWPEPLAKALWEKDRVLGPEDADALIRFLEIDPFFFRTGYEKPRAIQRLGRMELTPLQRARLMAVLEAIVWSGWERNVKGWRRLARVCDRQACVDLVTQACQADRRDVVKRATMLGLTLLQDTKRLGDVKGYFGYRYWDEAIEVVRQKFGP